MTLSNYTGKMTHEITDEDRKWAFEEISKIESLKNYSFVATSDACQVCDIRKGKFDPWLVIDADFHPTFVENLFHGLGHPFYSGKTTYQCLLEREEKLQNSSDDRKT